MQSLDHYIELYTLAHADASIKATHIANGIVNELFALVRHVDCLGHAFSDNQNGEMAKDLMNDKAQLETILKFYAT